MNASGFIATRCSVIGYVPRGAAVVAFLIGIGWLFVVALHRPSPQQKWMRTINKELPSGSSVNDVRAFLARKHMNYDPRLSMFPGIGTNEVPGAAHVMQAAADEKYVNGGLLSGIYMKFIFDKNKRFIKATVKEEGNWP